MKLKTEWKQLGWTLGLFLLFFWLPLEQGRFTGSVMEALHLSRWYAREHVLLCLVPAFFIAGAIGVFVSQAAVMKYLGAKASRVLAYGVASVSGSILAVCSCTVLPLFAGIWRMGAGLGPACAFLYSGPAINVLAVILTARILGLELGIARAVAAVLFSVVIGLVMHFLFRREEAAKAAHAAGVGATIRVPLGGHSGIPGDIYNGSFGATVYWPEYIDWLLDYFQTAYPLYPPNLLASYCNSGFNLVGEIIARHDGADYADSAKA